ncbi:hypothetical protein C2E21_7234 [Chlorella sorokiniana]|uniref:Uncharacterized protein n=1 Tax=Chlorella sorokiniana TaxID=3076 RepID=A0A2P6TIA9_CHLSO|nr:hypothetical protein C2E21_7234 [Chlorella sorokiniana]|eukprot:PRW34017.1 hypothetical protein C2E21_7234 [Chlorella sorokiniana]
MRTGAARAWALLALGTLALCAPVAVAQRAGGTYNSAGGFCLWSQINYTPFVPETDFYLVNHTIIRSCSENLTPLQRSQCLGCAAQTSREGCLGTNALTWFDEADQMSCTWVDRNGKGEVTRELDFRLGINNPSMFSSTINMGRQQSLATGLICAVTREYTVYSKEYHTAYFSVVGNGEVDELGPNDGDPLPGGRQPDASCVVQPPNTKCSFTLYHVPALQWAISSREFWTTDPALMRQLAQGSEDCLARKDLRCPRTNPPFHYSVRITEHKCQPNQPIPEVIRGGGQFPMGMPGYVVYPGGFARNYRQTGFELDVCDYTDVYNNHAYPATKCYGTSCKGSLFKPVARHDVLLVTYPRFPNQEQVVMPPETPPQTVDAQVWAWRTPGGPGKKL